MERQLTNGLKSQHCCQITVLRLRGETSSNRFSHKQQWCLNLLVVKDFDGGNWYTLVYFSEWLKALINKFTTLAIDQLALYPIDLKKLLRLDLTRQVFDSPIHFNNVKMTQTDWEKQLSGAEVAASYHLMALVLWANQISGDISSHSDPKSWPLIGQKTGRASRRLKKENKTKVMKITEWKDSL